MKFEINLADPYLISIVAGVLLLGMLFKFCRLTPKGRVIFVGCFTFLALAFGFPALRVFHVVVPGFHSWEPVYIHAVLFLGINIVLFALYLAMTKANPLVTFYKSSWWGLFTWGLAVASNLGFLWLGQFFNAAADQRELPILREGLSNLERYFAISGLIVISLTATISLAANFLAINHDDWENC